MENQVISEYTRDVNIDGKEMKAVIKAYEKSLYKTHDIFVRLEIIDGDELWGEMNWPAQDITNSEADAVFNDIIKHPDVYKSKMQGIKRYRNQ